MGTKAKHLAQFWRDRAAEARERTQEMSDPTAKATMVKLAEMYERLSERVGKGPSPTRED
jgi:hypothetical protein